MPLTLVSLEKLTSQTHEVKKKKAYQSIIIICFMCYLKETVGEEKRLNHWGAGDSCVKRGDRRILPSRINE